MKEWFKYEFGYVNIDSEYLYLTNTGNWSEISSLNEKAKRIANKNDNKSSRILFFLIVIACFFGFLLYKNILSGKVSLTLIFLTVFGGYKLYEYMKTEIGWKFKIPIKKITEIKTNDRNIELVFLNGENISDFHKLNRIDEKGIDIINKLKNTLHNRVDGSD
ncbi:hypothetical protein [Olleya sp. Bg11-27]|uniref:hypothetical protein n=1 Tax=Olleya sp. Bg11-27 TaxID=2058135 RepID=UPI000C30D242|nr:hypothetical protein [Olleya sp. Bg11-27]AUC74509.1 hypothetical protein CW732_01970 [Olleya sp. Bg11-27]